MQIIAKGVEDRDLKGLKTVLKHFWLMIKVLNEDKATNFMGDEQLNILGGLLQKVLNIVREVKTHSQKSILSMKKNLDLDEEDLDRVKQELSKQCEASTFVMEISG